MGEKHSAKKRQQRGAAHSPQAGKYRIDTGFAELAPDPHCAGTWTLLVNGVPSSAIVPENPLRLDFEYMQWIATCVHQWWTSRQERAEGDGAGRSGKQPSTVLQAVHLGGGACSLARYMAARYPRSRHTVVELDKKLGEYIRSWFDLPKAPTLKIRIGDARLAIENMRENSKDLIIRDVFSGSDTPLALTTEEFVRHARRLLTAGGLYIANIGDGAGLGKTRREAAAVGKVFNAVYVVADLAMLKGKRKGNTVIVASDVSLDIGPIAKELRHSSFFAGAFPAVIWDPDKVRRFLAQAKPLRDRDLR